MNPRAFFERKWYYKTVFLFVAMAALQLVTGRDWEAALFVASLFAAFMTLYLYLYNHLMGRWKERRESS